jgi:hypothetical protein
MSKRRGRRQRYYTEKQSNGASSAASFLCVIPLPPYALFACVATLVFLTPKASQAHSGPPYPIVSNQIVGPYDISIWTDPDASDDGSAAGKFWVVLQPSRSATSLPAETRATVSIAPLDRAGASLTRRTEPVDGQISRQFVALVIDHEGPFSVRVSVAGPLGAANVESRVDATYDLRPPPVMLAVYLAPFVLVGFLWIKLLVRRRAAARGHRES